MCSLGVHSQGKAMAAGTALATLAISVLLPSPVEAIGTGSRVHLTHLTLPGNRAPHGSGIAGLAGIVRMRTNVNTAVEPKPVSPSDGLIYRRPLLWTTARGAFPQLDAPTLARLRRHLTRGGTWILDGPLEKGPQRAFLESAQALALQLFPRDPLLALPTDHTLFMSFYLLSPAVFARGGSVLGVSRDGRAALIVVQGLAAAGAAGASGLDVEHRLRLAVNIVLYALTVDYKSDQVHAPAILRRRQVQPGRAPAAP